MLTFAFYLFCCYCCTYKQASFSSLEQSDIMAWVQVVVYLELKDREQGWDNDKDTTCKENSTDCFSKLILNVAH